MQSEGKKGSHLECKTIKQLGIKNKWQPTWCLFKKLAIEQCNKANRACVVNITSCPKWWYKFILPPVVHEMASFAPGLYIALMVLICILLMTNEVETLFFSFCIQVYTSFGNDFSTQYETEVNIFYQTHRIDTELFI